VNTLLHPRIQTKPSMILLALHLALGLALPAPHAAEAAPADPPDHAAFTEVLERVVRVPWVDYAALVEERAGLDRYLASLAATDRAALDAAPQPEQLAFWINAYNACMLRLVADHYPIARQRVGLFQRARIAVAGYPENSVWQIRDVFSGRTAAWPAPSVPWTRSSTTSSAPPSTSPASTSR
jgi:hypothetical protein